MQLTRATVEEVPGLVHGNGLVIGMETAPLGFLPASSGGFQPLPLRVIADQSQVLVNALEVVSLDFDDVALNRPASATPRFQFGDEPGQVVAISPQSPDHRHRFSFFAPFEGETCGLQSRGNWLHLGRCG